jgi:hypothetical protein
MFDSLIDILRRAANFLQDYNGAVTAAATVAIGVFTWFLVRVSSRQAKLTKAAVEAATAQAEIAKRALTELERPYVFIFNVGRLEAEVINDDPEFSGDALFSVTYSVANYGKTPAVIERAQAGLIVAQTLVEPDRLGDYHSLIVSPILAPGEARHDLVERLVWDDFGNDEDSSIVPNLGDRSLFFAIIISYHGPFTNGHETRAYWRLNEATGRLVGLRDDPKYSCEK